MASEEEFAQITRIEITKVRLWVDHGWIAPAQEGGQIRYREVDIARASLIHDLTEGMGVNDEGVGIVLDLVDQLHGLRHDFERVMRALQSIPDGRDSSDKKE